MNKVAKAENEKIAASILLPPGRPKPMGCAGLPSSRRKG